MKLYHFILIFIIIALCTTSVLNIKTDHLKAAMEDRKQIDRNLNTAIDDGVAAFVRVDDSNRVIIDKDAAIHSFFLSLASSFGVLEDQEAREKLELYVPVVAATVNDGYYIFYSSTYKGADGKTYTKKQWTEKFPFYYEDNDFVYSFTLGDTVTLYDKNGMFDLAGERKVYTADYHDIQTVEEYATLRTSRPGNFMLEDDSFTELKNGRLEALIQDAMAYYTSQHNRIASQNGITYNFALPATEKGAWETYLSRNSFFVVFQGYPFGEGSGEYYNRIASAGAKISKNDVFYLEQKGWYYIYHRSACPILKGSGMFFLEEPYYATESCVKEGAYACPVCNANGVYAPDYKP